MSQAIEVGGRYGSVTVHWLRVEAPHFVAALAVEKRRVTETAPILSFMRGWSAKKLEKYIKQKKWSYPWLCKRTNVLGPIQAKGEAE